MSDRMTSDEAARRAADFIYASPARALLSRAADALKAYEAEDAARAAMPDLACPWVMLDRHRDAIREGVSRDQVVSLIPEYDKNFPQDAPHRAVRLAVVEVTMDVAPAPPPERVQGDSGWWYELVGGSVNQYEDGDVIRRASYSDSKSIPPADRALVARLLGEVG